MSVPFEVIYKGITDQTKAILEPIIDEKLVKLDKVCPQITTCQLTVQLPPSKQQGNNLYHVRLDIRFPPHHEVVIKRDPCKNDHEQLSSVVRSTFKSARRQIMEILAIDKNKVKAHNKKQPEFQMDDEEE